MTYFSSRARRAFGALAAAAVLGALPHAARADAPALKVLVRTSTFVPQVLAPGTSTSALSTVRAARSRLQAQLSNVVPGATIGRSFNYVGWSVLSIPAGAKTTALKNLQSAFGANNVEADFTLHASRVPNDPLFGQQYGMTKINAPLAWNVTTGSSSVIIAVIDTGANLSHPDLRDNLFRSPDGTIGFNALKPGTPPEDDNVETIGGKLVPVYHGTHCAGNIGARGNNGIQTTGVNWTVKIIPVKFLNAVGSGNGSDEMAGINFLLGLKAKGVNIRATSDSYGGPDKTQAESDAFDKLYAAGILNFVAAGNEAADNDVTPSYPANFDSPGIVAVGASDRNDAPAVFSNVGLKNVDLFAPGVDILSLSGNGGTLSLQGTSMATPIVAGAAGLIWSVRPGLSALQMKLLLMNSVAKVASLNGKCVSGGRVDLGNAFQQLGPLPTPIPPTPTPTPEPSFVLSGTVYSSDKTTPLTGATVTLSSGLKTTSDAAGAYTIAGVKAGKYDLSGVLSGYSFTPVTLSFVGQNGGSLRQNLQATTPATGYVISGFVRNSQGRNMAGIPVLMNGENVPVAVSDKTGAFKISNLGPGTYNLSANVARQLAVAIVTVAPNATNVILQPKRGAVPSAPGA